MKTIRVLICAMLVLALLTAPALAFDGLKKGDGGNDVQMLQLRLNELGYSVGKADADYGNKTVKAVERFQSDHGLETTGAVDQATWDALYDEHVIVVRDGYRADVALTAPFTAIKDDPESPQTAWLWLDDLNCAGDLIFSDSMDRLVSNVLDYMEHTRYAEAANTIKASNYDAHSETLEINGHPAALIQGTFEFNNGGKLVDHFLWGAIQLTDEGDRKATLRFNTAFSLAPRQESLLTLDRFREMLERVTLLESPASAPAEPDPILGDWYIQDGTDSITLHIHEDGTYTADFESTDNPAQGTWKADGDIYAMDDGTIKMTFDGETLVVGETGSDNPDVFGRERVEPPKLPAVTDATEADYLGEWKASGLYMCDQWGMPVDDDNMLVGEDNVTVTVTPGSLQLSGLLKNDESYDTLIEEGGLSLGDGSEESTFSNGKMQLLEDGSAEIYVPGMNGFICLTLERA